MALHRVGRSLRPCAVKPICNLVQLSSHDEVVLVQPFDLLRLERHGRITPAEGDVRVVSFLFRQIAGPFHKRERLGEVLEPIRPLDPVTFITNSPLRGLMAMRFDLVDGEGRNPTAAGRAGLADEGVGFL